MRYLSFLAAAAVLASCATPVLSAEPIPVAAFFQEAKFADARLSPDGSTLAVLVADKTGRLVLAVRPAAGGQARELAAHVDADVSQVQWLSNQRLIYTATERLSQANVSSSGAGMYAVDKDGGRHVQLVGSRGYKRGDFSPRVPLMPFHTQFLAATDSDEAYVTVDENNGGEKRELVLYRLNTVDGNAIRATAGLQDATHWMIDENFKPRAALTLRDGVIHVMFLDDAKQSWRQLAEYPVGDADAMTPYAMTRDGEFFMLARSGRDTDALYQFDLAANKLAPAPVIGLKRYDFSGSLVLDPSRTGVLGARYETSEPVTTWFDERLKAVQAKVDAKLPATINSIFPGRDNPGGPVVVYARSDREPGFWQLFDPATGAWTMLGTRQPGINPLAMGSKKEVRYTARDGLEVPAYLTVPSGSNGKNLPLVLVVHDGPWMRGGHMAWDPEAQLLASRGYAVLEPEYRGSLGYGYKHFKAGWKQWGKTMQDDLADGVRWAIGQGIGDPKRVCVIGNGSNGAYGGYAALMALAREGEMFRCGVDALGVTDLQQVYDNWRRRQSNEARNFGLPMLLGDAKADEADLRANSPIHLVGSIRQPVLMGYGGAGMRIITTEARTFYKALKPVNKDAEWMEIEDEYQPWYKQKSSIDYWTRVDAFLARQLGK